MSGESSVGSGSRPSSYQTTEYLANINKDDEPSNQEFDPQELFNQLTNRADVVLVVEGKDIHTQRILLTGASPVFERMLQSRNGRIELLGKRYTKIQEMLTFLYPFRARITSLNKKSMRPFHGMSFNPQQFEIPEKVHRHWQLVGSLKGIPDRVNQKYCKEYLLSKKSTVDLLIVAQDYELQEVLEKCIKELGNTSIVLDNHPRRHEITTENASTLKSRQLHHVNQLNEQLGWGVFAYVW